MEKLKEKKRILIIGSSGMLGHQVYKCFKKKEHKYDIWDITRSMLTSSESIILDVTNRQKLEQILHQIKPNYVINCVGILISKSNSDISNAIYVNSYLPHFLAKTCSQINSKLIHISTDCVFSGLEGQYKENDEKDGKDNYAKTKALGEVDYGNHLTIRTSIIGPELKEKGEGLLQWFLSQNGTIQGYKKSIWSGVTTLELARFIEATLLDNLTGIYHVTNNTSISKYELLRLFEKFFDKKISINAIPGKAIDKSFIDTKQKISYKIPSYEVMVGEMADDMKANLPSYKHYSL
ncbi:SDR family oxidoreductase [Flagellimonas sp. 389]|uniref:dTDP-4-dehydrorhamnose reductase family protein n=1 Tax=Flagellimonas sp. 389 TaxID=2835862 RepID=UPI001BD6CC80|nr:SDR family oxidoreductase [Flagellimonas sp. 389]MBS9461261.1 SDR family oxidoreductase [Flagellimonas sp. 389]